MNPSFETYLSMLKRLGQLDQRGAGELGSYHGLYIVDQAAALIFVTPAQEKEGLKRQIIYLDPEYGTLPVTPRFDRLTV